MKTKLLTLIFVHFFALTSLAENVITYTASKKLAETIYTYDDGLYTKAFNVSITHHTFSNGTGTIIFSGDVTSIGNYAFYGCTGLTSITIPNSVTSIGNEAFNGCSGLTSVTIGNSVTSIGYSAFSGCSGLTSVTIGNSVTSIGSSAFYGCSGLPVENGIRYADTYLVEAVDNSQNTYAIKDGTKWIGESAFAWCFGLTSITIPESVTSIGSSAFYGCSGLTSITIPNSVTSIGDEAFYDCSGLASVTIPNSVTSIGYYAFSKCSGLPVENGIRYADTYLVEAVDKSQNTYAIKDGTKWIGGSAFYGCTGLTSITIPKSVTSIGSSAFSGCSGLTSVTIGNSVTSIESSAFSGCSGLPVENGIRYADTYLVEAVDKSQNTYAIKDGTKWIGGSAFYGCTGLTSITIPKSVMSIGSSAFSGCSGLTSITIPESATSIGTYAFRGCSGLTSITIPNSVTSIGNRAFWDCSGLTFITIGNSVTSIGDEAFFGCSGLTTITIPNSVTSIGNYAFEGCSGLVSIGVESGNIKYDSRNNCNAIIETANNTLITGCQNTVIPNSVTSIGDVAFRDCTGLTSITIPNSVTSIGSSAFYRCSGLTSITIPSSVTYIGNCAFYGCSGLASVTIPNSVTSIGWRAFEGCSGLTSITIPESVTSIGNYAFEECSSLTSIIWNAENCPSAPFSEIASQITCFTLGERVISLPASLCGGMNKLSFITIPNSVTSIGDGAFEGCTSLKTIYNHSKLHINKGETNYGYIGYYADTIYNYYCGEEQIWEYEDGKLVITGTGDMYDFAENAMPWYMYRDSIRSIIINDGVTSIGTYAFSGLSKRGNFTQIAFPSSLLSIGEYAFAGDSYLKSIHFGASVESIGDYAFQGCTRVSEMTCLSELTPEITSKALEDISSDAYLYVPSEYLREYQLDPNWKRFVLMTLGAETTTATDVTVTPYDNEALFTWPISDNAATYTIEITKDGVVFCTLVFNANGQLTGIAFAPARNGSHNTPSTQVSATGMSFTVTGLSTASHYAYSIQAKSANNQVIASYSGEFSTNGYVEDSPTAIEEITVNKYVNIVTKLLRDGQLLIQRDGKTYNMQGAVVK